MAATVAAIIASPRASAGAGRMRDRILFVPWNVVFARGSLLGPQPSSQRMGGKKLALRFLNGQDVLFLGPV